MTTVTGALILRDDRFLICRRRTGQLHPLKWEFAGGKCEEGETTAACLKRELREELSIEAEIGREIERFTYTYPGRNPILLVFYLVTDFRGEPRNLVFEEIRWVARAELVQFDFLEADKDLVKRLAAGTLLSG